MSLPGLSLQQESPPCHSPERDRTPSKGVSDPSPQPPRCHPVLDAGASREQVTNAGPAGQLGHGPRARLLHSPAIELQNKLRHGASHGPAGWAGRGMLHCQKWRWEPAEQVMEPGASSALRNGPGGGAGRGRGVSISHWLQIQPGPSCEGTTANLWLPPGPMLQQAATSRHYTPLATSQQGAKSCWSQCRAGLVLSPTRVLQARAGDGRTDGAESGVRHSAGLHPGTGPSRAQ